MISLWCSAWLDGTELNLVNAQTRLYCGMGIPMAGLWRCKIWELVHSRIHLMGFLSRNQSSVCNTPTCSFEQVRWSVIKPRRVFHFSRFISRFFLLLGDPDDGDLHVKVLKWDQKFSRSSHLTPSYKNVLNDGNLKDLMIQANGK